MGAYELNHDCAGIKFTQKVKVTAIFYRRIKHDSFLSLCVGEYHGDHFWVHIMRGGGVQYWLTNYFKLGKLL